MGYHRPLNYSLNNYIIALHSGVRGTHSTEVCRLPSLDAVCERLAEADGREDRLGERGCLQRHDGRVRQ